MKLGFWGSIRSQLKLGTILANGGPTDTTPPTVTITSTESNGTTAYPIPITITFSETVTGFVVGGITVAGGTLANFAGSGASYTVNLLPTATAMTLDINAGVCTDAAGNPNQAAVQFALSGWTPATALESVTPQWWFLPNDTTTLFQDNAKTTPATADNDPIGAIADKSGNGNDILSTSDATRPNRKNNAQNGKVGIYIDATTKGLAKTSLIDSSYQKAITVVCASNGADGVSNHVAAGMATQNGKDRYFDSHNVFYIGLVSTEVCRTDHSAGFGKKIFAYSYNGAREVRKVNHHTVVYPSIANLSAGDFVLGKNNVGSTAASTMEVFGYKKGLLDTSLQSIIRYEAIQNGLTVPAETGRIIFMGDSLTSTTGTGKVGESYGDQFMVTLNDPTKHCYRIYRTDGITAEQYVTFYPNIINEFLVANVPVFLWLGTNDLGISRTAVQTAADIATICSGIKTAMPSAKIVIATVIARGTYDATKETQRLALNTNIRTNYATTFQATALLDLAGDARFQNASDTTYYNADTIHLNTTGYGVVATLARTVYNGL